MAIPFLACMAIVASIYHLPPRVLPSIQLVEGGAPGAVSRNTDGSEDLGVMQVNTLWIAPLSRYTGLPPDVVRGRLISVPCFNVAAAGAILRTYLDEAGGDLMRAIGFYHSHTPSLSEPYRLKVRNAAELLFVHRNGIPANGPPSR
jgi:hypothetical protein